MSEYEKKAREISIDVLRHLKWCPETPESQNHAIAQIQPTIFAAIEEAVAAEREACARTAANPGFIRAQDTEWDDGVEYAKLFIATAIRARKP